MTLSQSKKRAKLTGKGKNHTFLALPHFMMASPEWARLSGSALKLLIEIARQFSGYNNGDLSIPLSSMKKRGFNSASKLDRCKKELIASRFILLTRQGGLNQCSHFAVSWLPIDECKGKLEIAAERNASHAWKNSAVQSRIRINTSSISPDTGAIAA